MPDEIELKLRIDADDIPRLHRHRAILDHLSGEPETRRLISTYYDTPDLQLMRQQINLRVRHMAGGWFQAVKGRGQALAGLHQRMEWEDIISGSEPDFSKITDPSLAGIFSPMLKKALAPIFVTDVERTEWLLSLADGTIIEVAADLGRLEIQGKSEPISEVELELKQGEAWRLFELAADLQKDFPLWLENVSKAERGYRHLSATPLSPSPARAVELPETTPTVQAFQAIGLECLRQMQANQELTLLANLEARQYMHAAIRRLRLACRLFRCTDPALRSEVQWLERLFDNAHRWKEPGDELLEQLPASCRERNVVQERLDRQRYSTERRLFDALSSQRYQSLLLRLGIVCTKKPGKDDAEPTKIH